MSTSLISFQLSLTQADLVIEAIGGADRQVFDEQLDLELVVRSTTRPPK